MIGYGTVSEECRAAVVMLTSDFKCGSTNYQTFNNRHNHKKVLCGITFYKFVNDFFLLKVQLNFNKFMILEVVSP